MQQFPLNLNAVRAIRKIRGGTSRESVSRSLSIELRNIEKMEGAFAGVPDNLLAGIERLLSDRERLRKLVANLMQQRGILP